jgi:hypothetical protein
MNTVSEDGCCPECRSGDAQITATVSTGTWERHFYMCPACDLRFAGTWTSTHDRAPGHSRSYTSPSMSLSLA